MTDKIKVLYVDDETDIRTIAVMALSLDPDLEVRTAASGVEALTILDLGWRPDVALLDVMMPHMDGPALLGELRRREALSKVPAIFMTAKARDEDVGRYIAHGAIAVISKPFDPLTLAAELRTVLEKGSQ